MKTTFAKLFFSILQLGSLSCYKASRYNVFFWSSGPGKPKPFLFSMNKFALVCLYEFPIVAVINNNKLSGLKQHTLFISWFWKSEVLQRRCRQTSIPSEESRGESVCLF